MLQTSPVAAFYSAARILSSLTSTDSRGAIMLRNRIHASRSGPLFVLGLLAVAPALMAAKAGEGGGGSRFLRYAAPAGRLPATRHVTIEGLDAAVLPSGRLVTPAGVEVGVGAPKPFGLALSPDSRTLATVNSGTGPFSVTLLSNLASRAPRSQRIPVDATFMGIARAARTETSGSATPGAPLSSDR